MMLIGGKLWMLIDSHYAIRFVLVNNSRIDSPFQQVAVIRNGQLRQKIPLPDWAKDLLENYL